LVLDDDAGRHQTLLGKWREPLGEDGVPAVSDEQVVCIQVRGIHRQRLYPILANRRLKPRGASPLCQSPKRGGPGYSSSERIRAAGGRPWALRASSGRARSCSVVSTADVSAAVLLASAGSPLAVLGGLVN